MKKVFWGCLLTVFLYLSLSGCTDPASIPEVPQHYTYVPTVDQLQGATSRTRSGKRQVVLTWQFDTTNTNIRSWDIRRTITDTTEAEFRIEGSVLKPAFGYPAFVDSSDDLQFLDITSPDSVDVYYRIIPNGNLRSYVGKRSETLHILLYKNN